MSLSGSVVESRASRNDESEQLRLPKQILSVTTVGMIFSKNSVYKDEQIVIEMMFLAKISEE